MLTDINSRSLSRGDGYRQKQGKNQTQKEQKDDSTLHGSIPLRFKQGNTEILQGLAGQDRDSMILLCTGTAEDLTIVSAQGSQRIAYEVGTVAGTYKEGITIATGVEKSGTEKDADTG